MKLTEKDLKFSILNNHNTLTYNFYLFRLKLKIFFDWQIDE